MLSEGLRTTAASAARHQNYFELSNRFLAINITLNPTGVALFGRVECWASSSVGVDLIQGVIVLFVD